MKPKYLKRVEKVLSVFDVWGYRESDSFIEFNARPLDKAYPLACAFIDSKTLSRLEKLFGHTVRVTAYDLSFTHDGSDDVLYFICEWGK